MSGKPPISVEKYYPFTKEEEIEIKQYKEDSRPSVHVNKYIGEGCECGEKTLVLGYYDGDGDYSFIRNYFCSKCGGEIKRAVKSLGNGDILKLNKRYGKKIPLIPQKKSWIEDELIMEYNKELK